MRPGKVERNGARIGPVGRDHAQLAVRQIQKLLRIAAPGGRVGNLMINLARAVLPERRWHPPAGPITRCPSRTRRDFPSGEYSGPSSPRVLSDLNGAGSRESLGAGGEVDSQDLAGAFAKACV